MLTVLACAHRRHRVLVSFAPSYGFPVAGGGVYNPVNNYFVFPIQTFENNVSWKVGVIPIEYL
jgi:hypothetical protein